MTAATKNGITKLLAINRGLDTEFSVELPRTAISLPTKTKIQDLYAACTKHKIRPTSESESATTIHKNTTMTAVDAATIRLKSFSDLEKTLVRMNAPKKISATKKEICKLSLEKVNKPAITNVQECSKLDTGVGPSIASGNHKLKMVETLFNIVAKSNSKMDELMTELVKISTEASANRKIIATSPTRFQPIAVNAPRVTVVFSDQCPISLKLMKPTNSHVSNHSWKSPTEMTAHTENKNKTNFREKSTNVGSNSRYVENSHRPITEAAKIATNNVQQENS